MSRFSHSDLTAWRQLAADGQWADLDAAFQALHEGDSLVPEALVLRGECLLRLGRDRDAASWATRAISAITARRDRTATRALWNQLGVALFFGGDLDRAEAAFERTLALARQDGDELLVARACNNVGMIANIRGKRDVAVGHYQLAIPAYQRIGHTRGLAETYHNLALASRESNQLDAAEAYERHAIEFAGLAGNEQLRVMGAIGLAETALLRGDAPLAERLALRAAMLSAERNDRASEADGFRVSAAACRTQGKYNDAAQMLVLAGEAAHESGVALIEGEVAWERAQLEQVTGNEGWRAQARNALETFDRIGSAQADAVRRALTGPSA